MGDVKRDVPELAGWMSATDAALVLNLSRQSINKMINAGRFKSLHRIGAQYVVAIDEVERLKHQREPVEVTQ